jgi:hypothetical protein
LAGLLPPQPACSSNRGAISPSQSLRISDDYSRSTMAEANSEHLTSVAPSISRAKS